MRGTPGDPCPPNTELTFAQKLNTKICSSCFHGHFFFQFRYKNLMSYNTIVKKLPLFPQSKDQRHQQGSGETEKSTLGSQFQGSSFSRLFTLDAGLACIALSKFLKYCFMGARSRIIYSQGKSIVFHFRSVLFQGRYSQTFELQQELTNLHLFLFSSQNSRQRGEDFCG